MVAVGCAVVPEKKFPLMRAQRACCVEWSRRGSSSPAEPIRDGADLVVGGGGTALTGLAKEGLHLSRKKNAGGVLRSDMQQQHDGVQPVESRRVREPMQRP